MVFKVTKSIDFTMFLIRVLTAVNPLAIMQTTKMMIMINMKSILKTLKSRILKFIESMIVGLTLVEKRVGLIL